MSLGMETLLVKVYAPNEVPYWGDTIPVSTVRKLIDYAEEETLVKILDKLSDIIDGYSKLEMQEQAHAVNRAYELIQKEVTK